MTDDDQFTEGEAARRRDELIKRMLATPPQPRTAKPSKSSPKAKRTPVEDAHDKHANTDRDSHN